VLPVVGMHLFGRDHDVVETGFVSRHAFRYPPLPVANRRFSPLADRSTGTEGIHGAAPRPNAAATANTARTRAGL
jgi:hypothetical protein